MTTSTDPKAAGPKAAETSRRSALVMAPAVVFAGLAALFAFALRTGDPAKLPSALIGKPVPDMALPAMAGLREGDVAVAGFSTADLKRGEVSIVNFFASWCVPCIQEHPVLMQLRKAGGVRIIGINYKDPAPGGRRFLGTHGNPFAAVGVDDSGRAAIDWGVYGMPETFVVAGDGRIVLKHVGPMTPEIVDARIMPAIRVAGGAASGAARR